MCVENAVFEDGECRCIDAHEPNETRDLCVSQHSNQGTLIIVVVSTAVAMLVIIAVIIAVLFVKKRKNKALRTEEQRIINHSRGSAEVESSYDDE